MKNELTLSKPLSDRLQSELLSVMSSTIKIIDGADDGRVALMDALFAVGQLDRRLKSIMKVVESKSEVAVSNNTISHL